LEIALHTLLREGCERDYEAAHQVIPAAVAGKLRAAGVRDWRIWRDGRDVFHLVDVEDYAAMRAALRDDPDNRAWQDTVAPLFDRADSYDGEDSGLVRVWTLSDQLGASAPRP
jgi:L-rhamnose mutarotase